MSDRPVSPHLGAPLTQIPGIIAANRDRAGEILMRGQCMLENDGGKVSSKFFLKKKHFCQAIIEISEIFYRIKGKVFSRKKIYFFSKRLRLIDWQRKRGKFFSMEKITIFGKVEGCSEHV